MLEIKAVVANYYSLHGYSFAIHYTDILYFPWKQLKIKLDDDYIK